MDSSTKTTDGQHDLRAGDPAIPGTGHERPQNRTNGPKISFLIPSKNRLNLLKSAISSILSLRFFEFEIIVSDNYSNEDYKHYIDQLDDSRVHYVRTARPLSVTDNWNHALSLATGDYVLMLGDDDAVAPAFEAVIPLLSRDEPDLIYLAAYHYCYPYVLPGRQDGYLATVRNSEFLAGAWGPFLLGGASARDLANAVMDLRAHFSFNAQHFLVKKSFLHDQMVDGRFYRSPYPDYFAAIVLFWRAKSILVIPTEAVIIGISPKSYGFYYFNDQFEAGAKFLDNEVVSSDIRERLEQVLLPGSPINTNWLVSAEVARTMLDDPALRKPDFARYRVLQMMFLLRAKYVERLDADDAITGMQARLGPEEGILFDLLDASFLSAANNGKQAVSGLADELSNRIGQFYPADVKHLDIGAHSSIDDALIWLRRQPDDAHRTFWSRVINRILRW